MNNLPEILDSLAKTAADVARYSPLPAVSIPAGIVAVALKAGSAIAAAGQDPVVEITRILDRHPQVEKVRKEWAAFIDQNWPVGQRKTDPSPSSGSPPPASDPYEG